jgi:Putative regulator of cell autolysis
MGVNFIENKKVRVALLHVGVWLLYAAIIWGINAYSLESAHNYLAIVIVLMPYCIIFYINVFCLNLYEKRGIIWVISSYLVSLLLLSSFGYFYIYSILPKYGVKVFATKQFKNFAHDALLNYFHFSTLSILYYYIQKTIRGEQRLRIVQREKFQKEIENENLKRQELHAQKEKLQYEYALLRAQINPHFLHNTLNILFSQALDYSEDLANNILKLSRIMRYSLESVDYESGKVRIDKELEQLKTLLDIHNLRFGESKVIDYSVEGKVNGQMLPPLSIITVVENAFKYGDLKDPQYPLQIKVTLEPNDIHFWCKNKKKKNVTDISSTNIGLTNLTRRLEVSFKDNYSIDVINEEDFYTFTMHIKN